MRRGSLLLILLAGIAFLAGCNPFAGPQLGTLWDAPHFNLIDEAGQPFSSDSLAGRVWLADFIYTNCPDECPIYLSPKMAQMQKEILARGLAGKVNLVSFTVDPRRDTAAVLAEYGRRYGADPRVWRLLTGPDATIQPLLQTGFKVGAAIPADSVEVAVGTPGPSHAAAQAGYTLIHTSYFLLVDRHGVIRATYDGTGVSTSEMLKAAQQLLNEK